jgi:hypothetical protein
MLGKEDCPFATTGWTQVEALAGKRPKVIMTAFGVGTANTRDALEIVAARRKPLAQLLDALKAIPAVGCGVLLIVVLAEVGEVSLEYGMELAAATGNVLIPRRGRKRDGRNREALQWCREEYGRTRHGTTGIEPMVLFEEAEKATLKPLPTERFEVPLYKPVTVYADRFFTFEKKRYAMPETCRGKSFIARKSGTMLRVFDSSYRLLRSYPITGKRVSWLPGDFPESEEALMNGTYPRYLCSQARTLGPAAERLITELLKPHAWVKARLARGVLSVLEEYRTSPFLQDICSQALRDRVFSPKQLKAMLGRENSQYHFEFVSVMSEAGKAMTRDIHDYLN